MTKGNEHEPNPHGSCHCGAVHFEAVLDLAGETSRCGCSICTKSLFWKTMVPAADFTLLQGADDLADDRFGRCIIHQLFCKTCGVKPFGRVEASGSEDVAYTIAVAALDDATPQEWAEAPVAFQDGRRDDTDHPPAETRYL